MSEMQRCSMNIFGIQKEKKKKFQEKKTARKPWWVGKSKQGIVVYARQ